MLLRALFYRFGILKDKNGRAFELFFCCLTHKPLDSFRNSYKQINWSKAQNSEVPAGAELQSF